VLPDERDAAARLGPLVSGLGAATRPDLAPESAGRISPEDGAGLLDAAGRERLLGRLRRRGTEAALPAVVEDIELLDDTLARLHREGTSATLDMPALIMAEALVSLTERPAIPVAWSTEASPRVQTIDPNHPELGRFAGSVALLQSRLQTARLESVGRIDSGWQHVGTGFVVGPDLVLTNRHVLESCADPVPRRHAPAGWILRPHVTVNFSPGGDEAAHRFAVTDVVLAGDAPILGRPIDFDNLDLALLRVEASNAAGTALPGPVDVVPAGADWRQGLATLYLVGFPAPPGYLPQDEEGRIRRDVVDRLVQLFGIGFHRKFFSPGSVMGAGHKWVFDHDATTLGGNSGSLVGRLVNDCAAVGLHFAGDWLRANHAHDLAAVRAGHAALDARL
ncbi:MAG: trypsin-like serine peptidase, partial [Gemmobacter sp.]